MGEQISGRAKGGVARAQALTPEERRDSARHAAKARWKRADGLREAIGEGMLRIADAELQCYVLDDEQTRVLSRASFVRAIGRTGKVKGGRRFDGELQIPVFLTAENLRPFWPNDLEENSKPIIFSRKGVEMIGYRAELLPDVCDIFQDAERAGALRRNQLHIAEACRLLSRGLTRVGIIGLVDEATGFQERRDQQALQKILDAFLRKELAAWAKTFPDEFYFHIFRLRGWEWKGRKVNPPQIVAHYTKDFVYYRLAPQIVEELDKRNPVVNGRRRAKHFQWLTEDIGHPALAQHLHAVIGLMRASTSWDQFRTLLDAAFPKRLDTLQLSLFQEDQKFQAAATPIESLPLFERSREVRGE